MQPKLIAALGVLAVLGGGLYLSRSHEAKDAAKHSASGLAKDLPTIGLAADAADAVTKITIKNADKSDVTLIKQGEAWEVGSPAGAKASASNVKSLLDNLKELKAKESIDRTGTTYEQYELTDEKGLHVVAFKGEEKALDLYFGKSGSRGQLVRVAGKDGVYVAGGYSSYLYTREAKNWRETSVLKYDDTAASRVELQNAKHTFTFTKSGETWKGAFTGPGATAAWAKFDEAKVKDLLRTYKSLSAEDFGDDKSDTGLDKPVENGGVIKITLNDGASFQVNIGKVSKGSSRFATKQGDSTVYVVSSWVADWAVAEPKKFEKADEKKAAAPAEELPHGDDHDDHGDDEG